MKANYYKRKTTFKFKVLWNEVHLTYDVYIFLFDQWRMIATEKTLYAAVDYINLICQ
jgi:hypothetical protein